MNRKRVKVFREITNTISTYDLTRRKTNYSYQLGNQKIESQLSSFPK